MRLGERTQIVLAYRFLYLARNDVLWRIFFAAQQFRKAILAYSLHE